MEEERKNYFFVRIFDISPCFFTQISSGRAHWMQNLILHPMITHIAYFWRSTLPQKQEIPEKCDDDVIISFSAISCFWGRGVYQKYALWVLVQRALPLEIWVKRQGDMSKIGTKKVVFLWQICQFNHYG